MRLDTLSDPWRSCPHSCPARTPSHGRPSPLERWLATRPCGHRNTSVVPSGDDGAYHRRSRVETKMHCVKLLGQRLMARDFDRQLSELQVRSAVLNGDTALGIPVTESAE